MKKKRRNLASALVLFAFLSGCVNRSRQGDRIKADALKYYKGKYSLSGIEVVNSFKAGNSGLFGYLGVKDTAYEMSDGEWVLWDDGTKVYSDTRQAKQIREAFAAEIMSPLLQKLTVPYELSDWSLNRTHMESFDKSVHAALYDGDIRAFCRKERPELTDLRLVLEEGDRPEAEKQAEMLFAGLEEYVSGFGSAVICEPGAVPDGTGSISRPGTLARADMRFGEGKIRWYRQIWSDAGMGVIITGNEPDLVLEEGDLVLEEAGTLADVQQILDEAYNAMPVDAPENKKGGYMVHDRRHETRVVFDDLNGPYYRLRFSDKVRKAAGEDGKVSVYMKTVRDEEGPLYMYPGKGWSVYRVCLPNEENGSYESVSDGQIFFYGSFQREEYQDEGS